MSNEINIEELERLAKDLIHSAPWTDLYKDQTIAFEVTVTPNAILFLIDRMKKAEAELERERMRLAACGVVAMADTPESAAEAREMRDEYRSASCDDVARRVDECMTLRAERDDLAAKLKELEGRDWHDPVAYIDNGTGRPHWCPGALPSSLPHGTKLYARLVPAEMSPGFTDTARAAPLWVLWHHQGGSSPVGQPIRYALGMDAHEHLSKHQVQEARRWAALTKAESNDFRQARTAPTEPVNVDFGKRGENMFFNIGNQSFLLDYKPEEQDEFDFMKAMLLSAFSRITHGVKTESQPVNARLHEALKKCRNRFAFYVEHHRAKGDSVRADGNAQFVKLADEAISAAEAQQERLLQDMHDAGREVDRVMAEAAPKAVRLTHADIAKALASAGLKPEDYREDGEILPLVIAIESAALRKNGIEVAE